MPVEGRIRASILCSSLKISEICKYLAFYVLWAENM